MKRTPKTKKRRMSATEQSAAFVAMARQLETDERPEAFDRLVKRIAPKNLKTAKKR